MKKIVLLLFFAGLMITLLAETEGDRGFQMLKIISGTSIAAQGGTGAFFSSDAFSFIENPCAGLMNKNTVLSMTQNYWIFDTTINSIAYLKSQGKYSFGIAYRYLDYGKIDSYDDMGTNIGEFHPIDLNFIIGSGYRLTPDHYFGINLYGLYEKIDTASSTGLSVDLGYTYLTPIRNLKIAAAIKHLGITSKMNEESIELPITTEISIIKKFSPKFADISSEIKFIKHSDDDEMKAVLGVNAEYNKILNIRLGYKFNYDAEELTTGFGIKIKKIIIDYAFIPFVEDINDVHMIGISYLF